MGEMEKDYNKQKEIEDAEAKKQFIEMKKLEE